MIIEETDTSFSVQRPNGDVFWHPKLPARPQSTEVYYAEHNDWSEVERPTGNRHHRRLEARRRRQARNRK